MSARTILANGAWRFAPDEPPPAIAERSQAMLIARLVDEVTGMPPTGQLNSRTNVRYAIAKSSNGARVGVVGRPAQAFFAGTIALARVDISIEGEGFLPIRLDRPVGAQPGYPHAFVPPDLGDVALHRTPVAIAGRVISRTTGPLAGATVRVSGAWPVLSQPQGAASAPNVMAALSGLYADRPVGATLRRRNLTLSPQIKTLERAGVAGDRVVRLSDRLAIAVGQILAVESDDPARTEFVGIAAIDTGSSDDQPANVTLEVSLRRGHAASVEVTRAIAGAGGPTNAITRAARVADVSIWTAALTGIGPATTHIEIDGGGLPKEYHATSRPIALTMANGAYRLPPIHRVAAVELTLTHASLGAPVVRSVTPSWNATEQAEDFVVP